MCRGEMGFEQQRKGRESRGAGWRAAVGRHPVQLNPVSAQSQPALHREARRDGHTVAYLQTGYTIQKLTMIRFLLIN